MPASEFTLVDLMDYGLSVDPTVLNGHSKRVDAPTGSLLDVSEVPQAELIDAVKLTVNKAKVNAIGKTDFAHIDLSGLIDSLQSAKSPLQVATQFINAKYRSLKGAAGFLGGPKTAVTACPDQQGYFRHFQAGSIYWHPSSGVHAVHGEIRDRWSQLGWERSVLGYPTSDQQTGRDPQSKGQYSHFQHGSIYWYPGSEAFEVHGAIWVKYRMLGAEASVLGYPTTDERSTPDRRGRYNHFQAGSIYWTPETGAHEVHGLIRRYWASQGWERNDELGYPITDELIPDRRIGHVHPESRRKPSVALPVDVVKLPAEAVDLGFERVMANVQPRSSLSLASSVNPAVIASADRSAALGLEAIQPPISQAQLIRFNPSKSTAAETSPNRFSDFENGVVFWPRGDRKAAPLAPWELSADGGKMYLTAGQLVAKYVPVIRQIAGRFASMDYYRIQFLGTTGYHYDGTGVRNRNHRLNVTFRGRAQRHLQVIVQLRVEAMFEPIKRQVVGFMTDWSLQSGTHGLVTSTQLHQVLDGELWQPLELIPIDDTDAGSPLAVLSVKTMADGRINIFIEPNQ